jgi:hypothetical protein
MIYPKNLKFLHQDTDFDYSLRAKRNGLVVPEMNFKTIIKKMMTSDPDLVYISSRILFRMLIRDYGPDKLKIPPDSPDASFLMDLVSVALPKGSALTV